MSNSFEFDPGEKDRINGLSEIERNKAVAFVQNPEGRARIAKIFEKLPEEVTENDAVEAYNRIGIFLFSKEVKLDELTSDEIERQERMWQGITKGKEEQEPPFKKAA